MATAVGDECLRAICVWWSGVFFFKQKTAYDIEYGLVGSEMCIRDSPYHAQLAQELERLRAEHGVAVLWDAHSIRSVLPLSLIHI